MAAPTEWARTMCHKLGFIGELRLSTNSRLPLTRELSTKLTEGEKLKKSYFKINLSLRLLMCNITHQNPPPSSYVDKKRIQSWLNANRLQLPLHNLDLDSNYSISQNSDLSTQSSKIFSEGKASRELDAIDYMNATSEDGEVDTESFSNRELIVCALSNIQTIFHQ